MDHVKWFRVRAACERAHEELEILTEEFNRLKLSFRKMVDVWDELAWRSENKGYAAYAYSQSSVYEDLAIDCEDAYRKIVICKK